MSDLKNISMHTVSIKQELSRTFHKAVGLYELALYDMKLCVHAQYFLLYHLPPPYLLPLPVILKYTERVSYISVLYTSDFTTLTRSPISLPSYQETSSWHSL